MKSHEVRHHHGSTAQPSLALRRSSWTNRPRLIWGARSEETPRDTQRELLGNQVLISKSCGIVQDKKNAQRSSFSWLSKKKTHLLLKNTTWAVLPSYASPTLSFEVGHWERKKRARCVGGAGIVPFGKRLHNYGKLPCLLGKLRINGYL